MKKSIIIAKWEFFERVKRKSFIISMFIIPIILLSLTLLPTFLINNSKDSPLPIGIIDFSKKYFSVFSYEISKYSLPDGQPEFLLFRLPSTKEKRLSDLKFADAQVLSKAIVGYIIIDETNGNKIKFRTNGFVNYEKFYLIENALNKSFIKINMDAEGINPSSFDNLTSKIGILEKSFINANSEEDILKKFISSYVFVILLIIQILFSGGMFVRSLVLEKSNRIIEIILSSCTIKELLTGKVLGLSLFGLFQFLIWIIIGVIFSQTKTIDFSSINNFSYQLFFFILGYIFYSTVFIGLGSIVNFDHEAQQVTGLLSIFLVLPILFAFEIINAPNSVLSLILSYFPFTSSQIMLLRLNSTNPSLMEIISISLFLIFSIYLMIIVSAKLFRIGILNSGRSLKLKEIISWLKIK